MNDFNRKGLLRPESAIRLVTILHERKNHRTYKNISKELGISKCRVAQIYGLAMRQDWTYSRIYRRTLRYIVSSIRVFI